MEPKMAFSTWANGRERGLLPVVLQNLVAGRADLGTMLLEAGQDGEIALVDDRTAELLDITGAGLLLLRRSAAWLLLGEGSGRSRDRQQGECEEKFTHRIPSFGGKNPVPRFALRHRRNGFVWMGRRRVTQRRVQDKHGKCGQIYGDRSTLNNRLIFNVYFCHTRCANWLLQTMRRIARCCADGAGVNG